MVRNEYPRPQLVRAGWQNLNGEWQFDFDDRDCGLKERWYDKKELGKKIIVPFVYQSKKSGIGDRTPHDIVWYKRNFELDKTPGEKRVILHFGAVDYEAQVFVNGQKVTSHEGGHTPFSADITPYLCEGTQILAVRAYDPHKDELIPRGKQFWEDESRSIWYTNSTGIWQTVWLEQVEGTFIEEIKFTSHFEEGKVNISCALNRDAADYELEYEIGFKGSKIAAGRLSFCAQTLDWDVDLIQNQIFRTNFHDKGWSWTPQCPNLFDVKFKLWAGTGKAADEVSSYFGFRKVHTEKGMVYLNNRPFYQKLVLDQGYWPEGLLTAPEDEDYVKDITLAKEMGFNGCRKHQKMEDPRFLYWADQLGFVVWGECAAPPMYSEKSVERLMKEWAEIVKRDYSHPCIITWVPINESWGVPQIHQSEKQQHFSQTMYHYLHAMDHTRLVISNDGWEMTKTDICAIHNYRHGQKEEHAIYEAYKRTLSTAHDLVTFAPSDWDIYAKGFSYQGEPILLTEFGGIGFDVSGEKGWGYTSVASEKEFLEDYRRIMDAVYASEGLWGFCYTQLCDVEQEINGMLTYDRRPKCDVKKIKEINEGYHLSRIQG